MIQGLETDIKDDIRITPSNKMDTTILQATCTAEQTLVGWG